MILVRGRRGAIALFAFAMTAVGQSATARAADPVEACIRHYEQYETHLAAGDFLTAKKDLARCAAATCPGALQKECVAASQALDARTPTVVLVARDAQKRDLTDVRVAIDGVVVRTQLDGRELAINPGKHVVRFEGKSAAPAEQTIVVREREKGRLVEAELATATAAEPTTSPSSPTALAPAAAGSLDRSAARRNVPTGSWILGGVGLAGLGTSAVFGAMALAARSDANDCRPDCTSSQVERVNDRLLGADIALGVGVVSLAAALVVYWLQPPRSTPTESAAR